MNVAITSFTPVVQNRFSPAFYANAASTDLLLDETNGHLYQIAESISNDDGNVVVMNIVTSADDGGQNVSKFCSSMELIGDKVPDIAYVAYSDNDYQTFGAYRPADLKADRSQIRRCGKFRRRAYSITYFGAFPLRVYSLELDAEPGPM